MESSLGNFKSLKSKTRNAVVLGGAEKEIFKKSKRVKMVTDRYCPNLEDHWLQLTATWVLSQTCVIFQKNNNNNNKLLEQTEMSEHEKTQANKLSWGPVGGLGFQLTAPSSYSPTIFTVTVIKPPWTWTWRWRWHIKDPILVITFIFYFLSLSAAFGKHILH